MKWIFVSALAAAAFSLASCGNQGAESTSEKTDSLQQNKQNEVGKIVEDVLDYMAGTTAMKSYVSYDSNKAGSRPIVLVVPEWWGLNNYPRERAKMLARMGYLAVAVDMYGGGTIAANPDEAGKMASAFYSNPLMAKERMDAALAKAKTFAQADTTQAVAIGYCFGGSMVLNYAKMGAPVLGVVSFHGNLQGVPAQKGTTARFLICHGGADNFVPPAQVAAFRKSMDSAGLSYNFKVYDNATHAFTNPDATATGAKFNMPIRYNGAADTASWNDMKTFFDDILRK